MTRRDAMRRREARDLARRERAFLGGAERAASTVVGGVLALLGARRGGVLGAVLVAIGAYGVHRGVTGRCAVTSAAVAGGAPRASRGAAAITRGERAAEEPKSTSPDGEDGRPNGHGRGSAARSRGEPA